jgi:nitroreductase
MSAHLIYTVLNQFFRINPFIINEMQTTITIKSPNTLHSASSFITGRFSPRSFSEKAISTESLQTLFESASWAASANNEQPWEYHYAHHGTEGFKKIWDCLLPGNQPWAKNAAALVVAVTRKTFAVSGKPNVAAEHDLGMANANLLLQARNLDIFGHPMGGFDKPKTVEMLGLDENRLPVCVIALGYLGAPDKLEEPFKTRETTPRTRKPLGDFIFAL